MTIGAWTHASPGGLGTSIREALAWFDSHTGAGPRARPGVRLFVMGEPSMGGGAGLAASRRSPALASSVGPSTVHGSPRRVRSRPFSVRPSRPDAGYRRAITGLPQRGPKEPGPPRTEE